jgi:hypothetical protein
MIGQKFLGLSRSSGLVEKDAFQKVLKVVIRSLGPYVESQYFISSWRKNNFKRMG